MSWTTPRTWVAGEVITASMFNTHIRDNLLATEAGKVSAAGDLVYAAAPNNIARLPIGVTGRYLSIVDGYPSWDAGEAVVATTTDQVMTTSFANIPGWSITALDGEVYVVEALILESSTGAAVSFQWSVPAGTTGYHWYRRSLAGGTVYTTGFKVLPDTIMVAAIDAAVPEQFWYGAIIEAGADGTLQMMIKGTSAASTLKAYSWMRVSKTLV